MSILDWMDLYRRYIDAHEPFVRVLLECGDTDNEIVRAFNDYKRGYELLLIEYQSMPSAIG